MSEPEKQPFISLFPGREGPIACRFYNEYRAHRPADAKDLVRLVMQDARERYYSPWARGERKQENRDLAVLLREHRDEAVKFAEYVIWRENLSPAEHAALKEKQAQEGRMRWMDTQEPTEKQIAYLRKLGYEDEIESRGHASRLIEELKGEQDEWEYYGR